MPRYYFDLEDDGRLWDGIGAELEGDGAAKQEATLRAVDDVAHQLTHYSGKARVIVRNDAGADIHAISIVRPRR